MKVRSEDGWKIPGVAQGEHGEWVDVPADVAKALKNRAGFEVKDSAKTKKPAKEGD